MLITGGAGGSTLPRFAVFLLFFSTTLTPSQLGIALLPFGKAGAYSFPTLQS
jgi:hypothetical protein